MTCGRARLKARAGVGLELQTPAGPGFACDARSKSAARRTGRRKTYSAAMALHASWVSAKARRGAPVLRQLEMRMGHFKRFLA